MYSTCMTYLTKWSITVVDDCLQRVGDGLSRRRRALVAICSLLLRLYRSRRPLDWQQTRATAHRYSKRRRLGGWWPWGWWPWGWWLRGWWPRIHDAQARELASTFARIKFVSSRSALGKGRGQEDHERDTTTHAPPPALHTASTMPQAAWHRLSRSF